MARYRRRYRTIVRAPKKKWASNMIGIDMTITNSEQVIAAGYDKVVIASNKTESTTPTPVVVKTGNFKVQGDMYYTGGSTQVIGHPSAILYIVFVPEGMEPQTGPAAVAIVGNHPEWILTWRLLESNYVGGAGIVDTNRFTLSSRLKRNLNSGDAVYAIVLVNSLAPSQQCHIQGACQFWTCAN